MSAKNKISTPLKTVLTICIGFAIIYLISQNEYFLYVSIAVGLLGLISDYLAQHIHNLWMLLTKVLSYIVPNILLSLVFFLVLFPTAQLSKLFGKKDPLKLKKSGDSTFVEDEKTFDKASFEQTF